jgi:hypothetical protein
LKNSLLKPLFHSSQNASSLPKLSSNHNIWKHSLRASELAFAMSGKEALKYQTDKTTLNKTGECVCTVQATAV